MKPPSAYAKKEFDCDFIATMSNELVLGDILLPEKKRNSIFSFLKSDGDLQFVRNWQQFSEMNLQSRSVPTVSLTESLPFQTNIVVEFNGLKLTNMREVDDWIPLPGLDLLKDQNKCYVITTVLSFTSTSLTHNVFGNNEQFIVKPERTVAYNLQKFDIHNENGFSLIKMDRSIINSNHKTYLKKEVKIIKNPEIAAMPQPQDDKENIETMDDDSLCKICMDSLVV